MWIGYFVIAYLIGQAWKHARAQAGAEYRRARAEFGRQLGARLAAGQAAGPWAGWWWPGAGIRAWHGMRGPRRGSARTALPRSTPWRRVRDAATAGARAGAADGAARARDRRQAHRAARAAGTSWGRRTAGAAAGAAGYAAGRFRQTRRRQHRAGLMAACDDCGRICSLTAVQYQRRQVGGRAEQWLLCPACRGGEQEHQGGQPPAAGPTPAIGVPAPAADGEDLARWRQQLDQFGGAVTGWPAVSQDRILDPALLHSEQRGDDGYWDMPGQAPAALTVCPAQDAGLADDDDEMPAVAGLADDEMPAVEGTGYRCHSWHLHAGAPVPPAELSEAGRARFLAAIGQHELAGTVPVSATDGGEMAKELAVPGTGGLARPGEAYSYGSWRRATIDDAGLIEQLGLCLDKMLADLSTVNAGRTQVRNVTEWADRVRAEADETSSVISEMDRRYRPVIAAVAAAGGTSEICDISYYGEY